MTNATTASALPPLDERQLEAVTAPPGPLLVVAGAGSGKTRVLTERAARLCREEIVAAEAVLVITFTNRAAAELRERLGVLVGHGRATQMSVGTIHGTAHAIIRRYARRVGRTPRFSIYDPSEARRLVAQALADEGVVDPREAKALALQIGKAKARLVGPEAYAELLQTERTQRFARAFARYERYLAASDALDLDDLIVRGVALLGEGDLLGAYQRRFAAVMVDEFQDVNPAQYELVRRLVAGHLNLTAAGDDGQAIYRFRSADVANLLDFERDFPDAHVVCLERNYRSTGRIVAAAGRLAECNRRRRRKRMWTDAAAGSPVMVAVAADERAEARAAASWCRERLAGGAKASEVSVLFRTRAQSGALEDALLEAGVRYRLVGGRGLWETAAVRDLIAHLTLVVNPRDRLALARALALRQGVGAKAVERVVGAAVEGDGDLVAACVSAHTVVGLRGRQADTVHDFGQGLRQLQAGLDERGVEQTVVAAVGAFGLADTLKQEKGTRAQEQLERLRRFCRAARSYERRVAAPQLADFLAQATLAGDHAEAGDAERVTLSTLHAAKGCEWSHVWIAGLCEGLLPHGRALGDQEIEDERRLCYVGLTRARRELCLSVPRRHRGWPVRRSRFIAEAGLEAANAADREWPAQSSGRQAA